MEQLTNEGDKEELRGDRNRAGGRGRKEERTDRIICSKVAHDGTEEEEEQEEEKEDWLVGELTERQTWKKRNKRKKREKIRRKFHGINRMKHIRKKKNITELRPKTKRNEENSTS